MALLTCDFFSEALEVGTSMTVLLPQETEAQVGVTSADTKQEAFPVLYLLHGLSDDHTAWQRYTSLERYASAAGLAVVMPAVGRSFYADEARGHRYWTYLSEELPEIVESFFRVSQRHEDTYVAGLSMGGYGAVKLALTHPDRFAAAASLSGALDVNALAAQPERREFFDRVFGGKPGPGDDLFALLAKATSGSPPLHISCGAEDPLADHSRRFASVASAAGVPVTTDFRTGTHEWGLWDVLIQDVIDWLTLPGRSGGPAPRTSLPSKT
jgi:S-formylglutathione hydrolase FrmB